VRNARQFLVCLDRAKGPDVDESRALRGRTIAWCMQGNVAAGDVLDVLAAALIGHFAQATRAAEIAANLLVGTEQSFQRFLPTIRVDAQAGQDIRNGRR